MKEMNPEVNISLAVDSSLIWLNPYVILMRFKLPDPPDPIIIQDAVARMKMTEREFAGVQLAKAKTWCDAIAEALNQQGHQPRPPK
jgi:hypothetical protein